MSQGHASTPESPDLAARLRGRRVRERMLHASYYLDRPSEEVILLGLKLSLAAKRSRETEV